LKNMDAVLPSGGEHTQPLIQAQATK